MARNEGGDGEEREEDGVHGGTKITTRVGFEERTRECASSQKRATKSVSDVLRRVANEPGYLGRVSKDGSVSEEGKCVDKQPFETCVRHDGVFIRLMADSNSVFLCQRTFFEGGGISGRRLSTYGLAARVVGDRGGAGGFESRPVHVQRDSDMARRDPQNTCKNIIAGVIMHRRPSQGRICRGRREDGG